MSQEFVLIHDPWDHDREGFQFIGKYKSRTEAEKAAARTAVEFKKEKTYIIKGKTLITPGKEFCGRIMTTEEYRAYRDNLEFMRDFDDSDLDWGEYCEARSRHQDESYALGDDVWDIDWDIE